LYRSGVIQLIHIVHIRDFRNTIIDRFSYHTRFRYLLGRGVSGRGFGVKTPTLLGNFSNLLGVFNKKIPKPPLKFPVHTKKISKPLPQKIFGNAPAPRKLVIMPVSLVQI